MHIILIIIIFSGLLLTNEVKAEPVKLKVLCTQYDHKESMTNKLKSKENIKTKRIEIMKNLKFATFLLLVAMVGNESMAQNLTGQKIIENVYYRSTGSDGTSELSMHLIDSRDNERIRKIKQFSKDFGKEEKSIMFFLSPADVKNTSFMNWSYDDASRDDDQWIYLPALKKVKRISSDSKDDYFMGSDFTYDDLGDRHPDEDTHKLLREETIDGQQCYVVESTPKDEDYMYSKTITWVIKDIWIGLKKEFYDEDGDLLKILTVKKYEKIKDYWIISNTVMKNIQDDHTTKMILSNIQVDIGIDNNKFTERTMTRGL
ncbi:MAG: outer membrane lipoprotein-sorting protein [Bacteroidetes bacterium]|nr:outer membrane lipoprotein-sorting protein [Bacteroidota bacterium]